MTSTTRRRLSLQPLPILALTLAACRPAAPTSLPLSPVDLDDIQAVHDQIIDAERDHDWATLTALFDDDATIIHASGPPLRGLDAINRYLQRLQVEIVAIDAYPVVIDGSGDFAYLRGHYTSQIRRSPATESVEVEGNYLWILRRRELDGAWLVTEASGMPDTPAPGTSAQPSAAPGPRSSAVP